MGDKSKIEWTDSSWNPVTGCTEVSPGCDRCYAKTFAERWRGTPGHYFENGFDVTQRPDKLDQPLKWTRPRRIFVNSMSDLFHDAVPDDFIGDVFAIMALSTQHTFQLLTKRHGRMRSLVNDLAFQGYVTGAAIRLVGKYQPDRMVPGHAGIWPLPNVWLGVSVENQPWADIRVPALLRTPAAMRWLSCEPLLGAVDLTMVHAGTWRRTNALTGEHVDPYGQPLEEPLESSPRSDWVVAGGESGVGARPMHPKWARDLRDQCAAAGVPYFFKQWGAWTPASRTAATHLVQINGNAVDRKNCTTDNPYGHGSGLAQDLVDRGHQGWERMRRVPKNAAGRELDGRTHDNFPTARAARELIGQEHQQ